MSASFDAATGTLGDRVRSVAAMMPDWFLLPRCGPIPNHPHFPVLHYRAAVAATGGEDTAVALEALFARNDWPPQWRNGVYPFHHYHSSAHEVLGFAAGTARLLLGGPNGRVVEVAAGDVVVLPVGTGHCRVHATADFLVVGGYPPGQEPDLCREAPSVVTWHQLQAIPAPERDPVRGAEGPLINLWRHAGIRS